MGSGQSKLSVIQDNPENIINKNESPDSGQFNIISDDVLLLILKLLSTDNLRNIRLICKRFNIFIDEFKLLQQVGIKLSASFFNSYICTIDGLICWGDKAALNCLMNKDKPKQKTLLGKSTIRDMTSYSNLSHLATTPDGKLFRWGSNNCGQLGCNNEQQISKPTQIVFPNSVKIRSAKVENNYSLALTIDGMVYQLDATGINRIIFENGNITIKSIAISCEHAFALAQNGDVYFWYYKNKEPEKLQQIFGHRIIAIAAGFTRFMALDDQGIVLCYEWGNCARTLRADMYPMKYTFNKKIFSIDTGSQHYLALDLDGNVYSWSTGINTTIWSGNDTLGHGNQYFPTQPTQIAGLSNIVLIAAGNYHSLALDRAGNLYSWGLNDCGQLGLGHTINQSTPQLVQLDPKLRNLLINLVKQ